MFNNADLKKISGFGIKKVLSDASLQLFRKRLEKEYYANVNVRNLEYNESQTNLVIEFQSNLNLVEFLYHVQKRHVGQLIQTETNDLKDIVLSDALAALKESSGSQIEIEELTFFLSDTEITVKRIYENSVEEQIGNIFRELAKHCMYFTNNQRKVPSEIFIPVFEENLDEKFKNGMCIESAGSDKKDYFNFWGIYFSHNDDAVIYDLSMRSIISGDLYMLD